MTGHGALIGWGHCQAVMQVGKSGSVQYARGSIYTGPTAECVGWIEWDGGSGWQLIGGYRRGQPLRQYTSWYGRGHYQFRVCVGYHTTYHFKCGSDVTV